MDANTFEDICYFMARLFIAVETSMYKGEPLEEMYNFWMEHKARKEESHRKKLERDRKAKERYREKNRDLLREQAKAYYHEKKKATELEEGLRPDGNRRFPPLR